MKKISRKIFVVAHRGDSLRAPENTIPAYEYAIQEGADFIEIDIRKTSDGEIIVMHDASVDRTTNGHGNVSELSLNYIKSLDAGSWYSEKFKGVKIPTFEEVLQLAKNRVGVFIELKQEGLEEDVVSLLKKYDMIKDVVVLSSLWSALKSIKMIEPHITTMCDFPKVTYEELYRVQEYFPNIISIHKRNLDKEFIRYVHRRGILVNSWPVNTFEETEKAVLSEVDFITTDDPKKIIEVLGELINKD